MSGTRQLTNGQQSEIKNSDYQGQFNHASSEPRIRFSEHQPPQLLEGGSNNFPINDSTGNCYCGLLHIRRSAWTLHVKPELKDWDCYEFWGVIPKHAIRQIQKLWIYQSYESVASISSEMLQLLSATIFFAELSCAASSKHLVTGHTVANSTAKALQLALATPNRLTEITLPCQNITAYECTAKSVSVYIHH